MVILCTKESDISPSEYDTITARIEELLDENGLIVWWAENKSCLQTKRLSFDRPESCPVYDGAAKKSAKKGFPTQVARPTNPEWKLILHTRLRHGRISYDENDVKVMLKGWTAPQKMELDLLANWHSTNMAELLVYREIKAGNECTVAMETWFSGQSDSVKGGLQSVCSYISYYLGGSNTSPSNNKLGPARLKNT